MQVFYQRKSDLLEFERQSHDFWRYNLKSQESSIPRVVSHIPKFGDARKSPAGDAASLNCGICSTAVFLIELLGTFFF
jgi:hypothetical protein